MIKATIKRDNVSPLLTLWAKTDENDADNWHPLLFHLLDVGNVARLMWDQVLSPQTKRRITRALGLPDTPAGVAQARRVVVLLTAQHDLGKASSFQTKVPHLWDAARAALGLFLINSPPTPGHGYVSAKVLPGLIADGKGGWGAVSGGTARTLAKITGGHHGVFPTAVDLSSTEMKTSALGGEDWDAVRAALLEQVERFLFSDEARNDDGPTPPVLLGEAVLGDASLVALVGGLVSIADWIGSSQHHFFAWGKQNATIAEYAVLSRSRAQSALDAFHWTPVPAFNGPADFGEIFQSRDKTPFTPNPMQARVVECANQARSPYLLIVEAAMGEGKTEAALYAVDRALTQNQHHGFYVALPTQATGNALFARVLAFLEARKHGTETDRLNFQLAHGGSFLSASFRELQAAAFARSGDAEGEPRASDDESADASLTPLYDGGENNDRDTTGRAGRIVAEAWFTYRKRPLLAPLGVGTIDQTLVGVLQTKHWFVRLFGLSGKVVVFDEVHAYDVYMGELLGRLLGWLRALGCTVVLLSATLPDTKRRALITAWDAAAPAPNQTAYPRVTQIGGGDENEPVTATAWTVEQTTPAKTIPVAYAGLDFANLAQTLKTDLPKGGCAAVICNTVARARDAYRALTAALAPDGWTVLLFHARTLARWRQHTENEVLRLFGKDGARPPKTVLVATQVVEQSLDLDFDWMASEIAPVDLLLQRMGRLWRHTNRTNREGSVKAPRFYVLCGDKGGDAPPDFPPSTDRVYEAYLLLRTRLSLSPGPLILPDAIEPLIQAVYDAPEPEGLSAAWRDALLKCKKKMFEKCEKEKIIASHITIKDATNSPSYIISKISKKLVEEDDPSAHADVRAVTRLGDPSVSLICFGTDAKGEALANLAQKGIEPTKQDAREILGFGVSVSHQGLFSALEKQASPPAWKESPYLRFHRALHFENGVTTAPTASINGYVLRLSREEGLQIEKEPQETEDAKC